MGVAHHVKGLAKGNVIFRKPS